MQISLENVNVVRKRLSSGEVRLYRYHRKTGKRIKGDPGTLEFMRHFESAAISDGNEGNEEDKFSSLLKTYKASPDFRNLAETTQANYRHRIDILNQAFGELDIRAFSERKIRATVLKWRDEIALTKPAAAEAQMKLLKAILSFAEERTIIDANPLRGLAKLPSGNRVDCIWTAEQIKRVLAASPDVLQWCIKLALLTGQRKGDLIRLKWANIDRGFLRLTQAKTLAKVGIRVNAPLESLLAEIPRRAETILTSTYGKPWGDGSGVTWQWERAVEKAGLGDLDLTFHDLRGTAVTCLADMGCTEAEIAAITGHSLAHVGKILATYLKRTDAQSSSAMLKLESSWIGQLQATI